jgi:S-adenosylmethionine synthetase
LARNINVERVPLTPIEEQTVEIVERKGRGHPDYIADSISEEVSHALSVYYQKNFGVVLHHNVDKSLVVGGRASPKFGGGEVDEPIYLIVAGRTVTQVVQDGELVTIPVGCIAVGAMKEFLRHNLRFLDVERHVICNYMIRQGSADLVKNFDVSREMPLSNDTSFGVGFAPLSETERIVYETETYLNSPRCKKELPEVGEDIKVMGLRRNNHIDVTIAAPQISSLTPDLDHYLSVKTDVQNLSYDLATKITERDVTVHVNTADKPEKGIVYLTVTGTSAEAGDDGNTGRGNRVHGLITPCRPMSLEAAAGKNPINHVGKIYNVLAGEIAQKIGREVKGVQEVYVKLLSQIGKPIDQPMVADVQLLLGDGVSLDAVRGDVESLVDDQLSRVREVTDAVMAHKVMLF